MSPHCAAEHGRERRLGGHHVGVGMRGIRIVSAGTRTRIEQGHSLWILLLGMAPEGERGSVQARHPAGLPEAGAPDDSRQRGVPVQGEAGHRHRWVWPYLWSTRGSIRASQSAIAVDVHIRTVHPAGTVLGPADADVEPLIELVRQRSPSRSAGGSPRWSSQPPDRS